MIPKSIKVGPFRIPVKRVNSVIVNGKEVFGSYSDDPHQIEIEAKISERPIREFAVLVHECIEAMNDVYVIQLRHSQIEQLSTALTQLLVDNRIVPPKP